ncbi:MAG: hypothetical protein NY202_05140 [Mollicutes bacterium UO1]
MLFERAISEFLFYKIEEKTGVLRDKLRMNYLEEKEELKKSNQNTGL